MLKSMKRMKQLTALILFVSTALLLAACGGTDALVLQRANSFDGGALSNFGGTDGSSTDARDIARNITSGRNYDFTLTGFDLVDGPAQSTPAGGSDYGAGTGSVAVDGTAVTVTMDVASTNPNVTNVQLVGTFDAMDAAATIANPGSTFVVEWQMSFDIPNGASTYTAHVTAEQTLNGTDYIAI
jgi:hypothetical protein